MNLSCYTLAHVWLPPGTRNSLLPKQLCSPDVNWVLVNGLWREDKLQRGGPEQPPLALTLDGLLGLPRPSSSSIKQDYLPLELLHFYVE